MTEPRLQLPPEEMRALGYWVVDLLVDHSGLLSGEPVSGWVAREELERRFAEPPPASPRDWQRVMDRFLRDAYPTMERFDHPRFLAAPPGPGSFLGAIAHALASGLDAVPGAAPFVTAAEQIEATTLGWIRDLLGLPATASGLFVGDAFAAHLAALATARDRQRDGGRKALVALCSEECQPAVGRALRVLGIEAAHIRRVETDDRLRMIPRALLAQLEVERDAGRLPFCVVANAGAPRTGAVDPLRELAALCREEGLWLHADGTFGAAAALTVEGRALLQGLSEVDSLTLAPHHWMFQPHGIACALLREGPPMDEEPRPFRALGLWLAIQVFGADALRAAIERGLALARSAEVALRARGFEIVTPAQLGVVTFRHRAAGLGRDALDPLQRAIARSVREGGLAVVEAISLPSGAALRLCTLNPGTTELDLDETIDLLADLGEQLLGASSPSREPPGLGR